MCIRDSVDGKSTLSFIKIKTLYGVSETVNIWGEKVVRDSIAYHSVEKYLVKDLGTNPKGVFEHLGYPSTFGQVETCLLYTSRRHCVQHIRACHVG